MTLPNSEECFRLWSDMLDYCIAGDIDAKTFRAKQDAVNSAYKRMGYADQGEFHRLVAVSHKSALMSV
jgi:hypothetical protein